jgi:pseudouridine synthase
VVIRNQQASPMQVRLQKILSAAGVASRRAAEALIAQGRVSVNGSTVTELGTRADPEHDDIVVDGRRVKTSVRRRYLLLYKPRGYVSTRSDPQGRPTIMDLLGPIGEREYLYPVGRLDYDSEGLLLVTNDGDLAARLTHPRHGVEREYEALVRGVPDDRTVERLARGVMLDGRRTAPAEIVRVRTVRGRDQALLRVVVREGRNRQVRRMWELVGHPVVRLRRLRIGPLADQTLKPGEVRELLPREAERLRRAAGGEAPAGPPRPHGARRPSVIQAFGSGPHARKPKKVRKS